MIIDLLRPRWNAGCVVFRSARHNNRSVVFVGGGAYDGMQKSEILDYTLAGSTWQECNYLNIASGS